MLLIAVFFEEKVTCSCLTVGHIVNSESARECCRSICQTMNLASEPDEVLVVENDLVIHQYTPEDWS